MESTIHSYIRLLAMYIVDTVGLTSTSSSHCPIRRMGILYSTLSLWRHEPPRPTKTSMDLASLPPEILLCIGEHLDEKDLNSLIRTARVFAELLSPQLYDFVVGCRTRHASSDLAPNSSFKNGALSHAGRWHSRYALNYFRTKRADILLRMDQEGGLLLNRIARAGNAELVSILLARGADVNAHYRDPHALAWAAKRGHKDVVRILLDAGADDDVFKPCQKTLLHAVYRYRFNKCTVISQMLIDRLKERGEISKRSSDNSTVLHYAVRYNKTYAVPQLIKAGIDLMVLDSDGLSALDIAIKFGKMDVVHLLLQVYPGPWPSYYIQKAIWEACDRLDLEMLERIVPLVESRTIPVDISLFERSRAGLTALHVAARGPKDWARVSDSAFSRESHCLVKRWQKVVDLLLKMGASISARDCIGRTPFLYAVENGSPERIPFLLQRLGSTTSIRDHLGRTPLHAAVHSEKSELMVRWLLPLGFDINAQDSHGQTPLHYAATCASTLPTLEYLLSAGADDSICDRQGLPPSHFAATQRRDAGLRLFVNAGAALHRNCELCFRKSIEWRTDHGEWQNLSEPSDLNDLFDQK
ncbi:hypothetical protein D8B26_002640 [Coccidioides posadasii str. Silveira]|nr:Ankyrin repeat containing protein [Coccidioides posadasii C735 delta SOWgp]EER27013.1 Ankyrin repeat containing protein [Coccidioides posadasii C735 delta SOWgp]QVM07944.1 hypothetical protein D8B26_002640 [Coccidioides posadasii str. Silveira]|eukprot:XP_003069158.1 Ankyrin repeat containing protein [Coccidioides posadasii C735 delta SOWgp]